MFYEVYDIRGDHELTMARDGCDRIEETIPQAFQQAETLRQSILKKAFEGKLVKAETIKKKAS